MPIDLNSPFAQALIRVGQQRGYGPIQIASSIGNSYVENGLRTDGKPGDNGTAYGGFQWRDDRYKNLLNTAGAMGKAWNDPEVQANHWYNEQDGKYGSEKPYGDALKAARNLNEGVNSVVRSLRPAGIQNGPQGAMGYNERLSAAQEAFKQLTGSDGGINPAVAQNPADLPAPGAQNASFQMPQQAPPKEGWDAFLEGGPGALFGKPQQGWNIGDTLIGAGAALMARDKPEGAAALAKLLDKKKTDDPNELTTRIDPNSGRAYTYDAHGNVTVKQIHAPDAKPMPVGTLKLIQQNNDQADKAYGVLQKNQEFMELLKDGKVDLSAFGRLGNTLKNYTGSDEATINAAKLQAHLEDLRTARLMLEPGTKTEGDAQRALDGIVPGSAKFDNKTVAALLRQANTGFESAISRYNGYNEPIFRQNPTYDPDGAYKTLYENRMKEYSRRRDSFDEGYKAWTAPPPPSQTAADPTKTPTGRDPLKAQPKKKSFLDFY
jgi:YD repeat-containing protein